MNETLRYTFAYTVKSTGERSEMSVMAGSKEVAAEIISSRIADIEFTEEDDIELGELINISKKVGDNYIACEGCAS
ncbi:hypothetical protein P4H27_26010 [Paenibacillus taichungensis]|uniref:hypothetical protein n=1 Tax=Paenibacillus taichungensis TaxID=484184 RepID=UPI002DBBCEC0|nr:hypothetical protein [Paenibacillus taichungensis]MEC0110429.1 hypothetical protein [Paenibacillus taichungensis]MEC0200105.1 hypothetical protein [Paenibacillus taichungensis]